MSKKYFLRQINPFRGRRDQRKSQPIGVIRQETPKVKKVLRCVQKVLLYNHQRI
jgi:hypothetical protein